jgi:hypothetical protein
LAGALTKLISEGELPDTVIEVVDRALYLPEGWILNGNRLPRQRIKQLIKFVTMLEECAALIEADKRSLPVGDAPISKNSACSIRMPIS